MRPEGLEIIPQPPLGEHPRDLLPNRGVVLWAYTDLSDLRLTLGTKFWLLRQAADYPPIKTWSGAPREVDRLRAERQLVHKDLRI